MNDKNRDKMLDLLSDRTFSALSEQENAELAELEKLFPELKDDDSFEIAATAVSLTNLNISEPMPAHLRTKILADADKYFAAQSLPNETAEEEYQKTFAFDSPPPRTSSVGQWLGWLVAAAACIALAVNLWTTRFQPQNDVVRNQTPTPAPALTPQRPPTPAEERERLLASARDVIQTSWTDPKNPTRTLGDVVWSNAEQKGFLRFRALPANDPNKETYQLWIVDKTQKNPIDGGVFDVPGGQSAGDGNNELIIPIDAKLKVKEPAQFAVTAEKPGGVVVSELGKVMAVAKITA